MTRYAIIKHHILEALGLHTTFSDGIFNDKGVIIKVGWSCNDCEWSDMLSLLPHRKVK